MSFECKECGFQNNEIQTTADIQDEGVKFTLRVAHESDLQRMVVASGSSVIYLPELDFTVPIGQKGIVSSVSGIIMKVREDLEINQSDRKDKQPEIY